MRSKFIIAVTIGFLFLLISCNSSKMIDGKASYIIELIDEKGIAHLEETYMDYGISEIKRTSKSQNEITATFVCKLKDCQELEKMLSNDSKVSNFYVRNDQSSKAKNSKGSKAHRTGPIGSQGGQK